MFQPVRVLAAVRHGAPSAVLAASAGVTFVFSATPFLIPEVADRFAVSDGTAGLISVVQVAVFAATTLLLPRLVPASAQLFRTGAVALVVGNLLSVVAPTFTLLLVTRTVTGAAAGALTWLAWASAMGSPRALTRMSSLGPLTALVAAPLVAVVAGYGDRWVWALLALATVPGALLPPGTFETADRPGERSGSRSNRVLLGALFLLTLASASLFVFQRVLAVDRLAMTPFAVSLGFSANASAGLAGARLAARHRRPGLWLASCGPAAALSVLGGSPVWFHVGMAWWGFAFWMGVPGVLTMLAARSLRPDERAGDAQGLMAVGRSLGPGIGGAWLDAGNPVGLAVSTGVGLVLTGLLVTGVQEGREALPVTDPRTRPG